ncbi:nucleotide disphospho-sugar-binding domain-containing protein [Streptomyces virginiae]|uniref:nucleotide disphospho-sugar-binding domain-containing protein n=1 Tax=Streptomyces virginiae TaxID=1961 RepID=UPI003445FA14
MPTYRGPGAHIALMSVPLHGHVNPMLGLAAELVARGHRVTFATGDDFAPLVERTGATAIGYTSAFPSRTAPGRTWLPADDDGSLAVDAFRRECSIALPQVAAAYADDLPDLVVYDTVTGHAPLLARRWNVPEVQFSPTHALADGATGPSVGEGTGALSEKAPCIVAMPRSLQFEADKVGAQHTFVGPVPWQREGHGRWAPPEGDRRIALVSLGTTYNQRTDVFRRCVQAFEELDGSGWHVVLATGHGGGHDGPARLGELPPWVEVHEWVPQMSVLAHADVFLTAGGTGSVLEGLVHGVPLVVLPQAVEQFVTAQRIEALGLGRVVPPGRITPQTLRTAVRETVTDPAIGGRLSAVRAEMAEAGGARAAADVVEVSLAGLTPAGR